MSEDLIRRSDAIKAIEPYLDYIEIIPLCGAKPYVREAVYGIRSKIKSIPTIEPKRGEWIPCSERLPDDSREVLISLEWGIDIGTYERGEWRSEWINHYDDDNVLAWMPLPKPWKGADDEYERAIEQMQYDMLYEPTYNPEDGSM